MSNIEKAVEKFYEIRNIPYHIALNEKEENWQCETKNRALAKELEKLGYETRERIGLFRWSEVNMPKEIKDLPHDDESSHLYLEVITPGNNDWVKVDCTWNPELKKAGFPISEWNGTDSTEVALSCYEIIPVEKNEEYLNDIDYDEDMETNYKIYDAFNKYCDSFLTQNEDLLSEHLKLQEGSLITERKIIDGCVLVYSKYTNDLGWNHAYVTRLSDGLFEKIKEFFDARERPVVICFSDQKELNLKILLKDKKFSLECQDAVMVYKGNETNVQDSDIKLIEGDREEKDHLDIFKKVFCNEGEDVYSGLSEGYLASVEDYFINYPKERRLDFLFQKEGLSVGMASVLFNERYALITGVAVLKEFRGQGIAKRLVRKCICEVKDKVIFDLTEKDSVNEEIYKKMGFETVLIGKYYVERRKNG